jgi:C_GCAxxG_C_C family probable redox protein
VLAPLANFWFHEHKEGMMKNQVNVYTERAARLHANGHNCAQAVAVTFADEVRMDKPALFKISESFGRGMGNTDGTCGAISGALMILSLFKSGGDPKNVTKTTTYEFGATFYEQFVKSAGSATCRELQGLDTGTPLYSCEDCIHEAVKILYDMISEEME